MSTILISSAKLVLPNHALHGEVIDVLIKDGTINRVGKKLEIADKDVHIIDGSGHIISAGFFDLHTNFGEPGLETKEDIVTGTKAAAFGGYTGVAVFPNTNPPLHSRSEIALVINTANGNVVDVYPVGSISKKREGKELAEMFDMKSVGAIAFSDGNHSVQQAGLMSRALLYAKGIDALIVSFAEDESIAGGNQMNEGEVSTFLGMKGKPNLAESLMVSRDLSLAEYHDATIHFTCISTKESVELIRKAKTKGVKVTCDVAAHNLVYSDEAVLGFDSNFKVNPPLRTNKDVKALLKGLKDGTIDAVVSQHTPHEVEYKNVEFQIAKDGIIGLQTTLPLLIKAGLQAEDIVNKLVVGPRQIVKQEMPLLAEGSKANLVLFSLGDKWIFDASSNKSKSTNSPLFGQELTGKVKAIVNNGQLVENR
ncbi:dihydroorotase [Sphingobacterium deserti]|uniref:Dihydroorotase, multifunctional complex type n=1 Tax=Sphingobacterium deserti TaxID=1229276 RepID=A0A0B8SZK0_9SPHI|nr:dihydroorotase [Sphingobacterium deserti]KGE13267.1 dihydroorotase, multifunctional complex type [Sphingobacterium deserti]